MEEWVEEEEEVEEWVDEWVDEEAEEDSGGWNKFLRASKLLPSRSFAKVMRAGISAANMTYSSSEKEGISACAGNVQKE